MHRYILHSVKYTMQFDKNLNQKQRSFVEYYCLYGNGERSAIEAGYSSKSARAIASQNLTKLNILNAIQERKDLLAESLAIKKEGLVLDLERVKQNATELLGANVHRSGSGTKSGLMNVVISAVSKQAELLGFKGELVRSHDPDDDLTDEEIEEELRVLEQGEDYQRYIRYRDEAKAKAKNEKEE